MLSRARLPLLKVLPLESAWPMPAREEERRDSQKKTQKSTYCTGDVQEFVLTQLGKTGAVIVLGWRMCTAPPLPRFRRPAARPGMLGRLPEGV